MRSDIAWNVLSALTELVVSRPASWGGCGDRLVPLRERYFMPGADCYLMMRMRDLNCAICRPLANGSEEHAHTVRPGQETHCAP